MEDVIAVIVKDKIRGDGAFITWGRVFDRVDTKPIETKMAKAVKKRFGFRNIKSISVCYSLADAAHYPYFYEVLLK